MQYTQAQIDRANAVSLEDFLRTATGADRLWRCGAASGIQQFGL